MDIVCRVGGLRPARRRDRRDGAGAAPPRRRRLAREGGLMEQMAAEVEIGMANLAKHIENVRAFGIQPVVAINTRPDDEPELLELIKSRSLEAGAFGAAIHNGFGAGRRGHHRARRGRGRRVRGRVGLPDALRRRRADRDEDREDRDDGLRRGRDRSRPGCARGDRPLSRSRASRTCRSAWRRPTSRSRTTRCCATGPRASSSRFATSGSTPARACSCPLCGDMLQMPGLGAQPAAFAIDIDENGETVGLF